MFRSTKPAVVTVPLAFVLSAVLSGIASADINEVTSLLLKVCLAGGTASQVEGQAKGDVALTLNALKTGQIGADASLGGKYSKADWEGLQGGISSGMTALQADQADKARACLAPYMAGIVQAILQPKREAPRLPNFVSSRVDGGHSFSEFCEPQARSYREQYPGFTITWHEAGDGRDKDWKGHATYQYTCTFSAVAKQ